MGILRLGHLNVICSLVLSHEQPEVVLIFIADDLHQRHRVVANALRWSEREEGTSREVGLRVLLSLPTRQATCRSLGDQLQTLARLPLC